MDITEQPVIFMVELPENSAALGAERLSDKAQAFEASVMKATALARAPIAFCVNIDVKNRSRV
ncbi:hypothetical protein NKI39_31010 [Mesorhizobium sp. M0664]|uniref:hypothetical protein n=1 Tax=Mesorhizobium sp. M0664 TaxID=2956982 RepID=UPI00333CB9E3